MFSIIPPSAGIYYLKNAYPTT
jgi:hypothetical protein